ncbi:MAG: hypothetical protein AB7O73_02810 [Bacteroidia bacterium]
MLLGVLAFGILPNDLLHQLITNHTVEDDLYCQIHHANLGVHFEESHEECHLLEFETPIYLSSRIILLSSIIYVVKEFSTAAIIEQTDSKNYRLLPSRAPPSNCHF